MPDKKYIRKRPRQIKPQKLSDILHHFLKKQNIILSFEKQRLQEIWSIAVGTQIAEQTSPDRLNKGTLSVKVSSSVWMQQLHFLKEEIINKINQQVGAEFIKNIFFSIGDVSPVYHKNQNPLLLSPESFPLKGRDKKMIEQSISSISDQELREILKRVMTKDIIRRRLSGVRKVP
jgi:hypothetical protein